MSTPETNSEKKQQAESEKKKEKYQIPQEDIDWFWEHYDLLLSQTPILSSFLDPQEPHTKLVNSVSESILTNTSPPIIGFASSIISEQVDNETVQWSALFADVFLVQSPSFIFANASADKAYLSQKTRDFLDWLYSPLRIQYIAMIKDIITYNFSTYKIPLNLFKLESKPNKK